jgi:hypothetical protein
LLLLACLLVGLQAAPAEARRVALMVGNADYKVGTLLNPVNDAVAMAEIFASRLKFDKVMLKRNLGAADFRRALLEFGREASGAEVGAIYFAGHGVEVDGKNFLIPVDAGLASAGDLNLEAILLDTVLDQLAGANLKLVILDACRNSPYAVAGGKRTVQRGLSALEPEGNTLVAYAAKGGTTADDGPGGRHSPFTAALLKHIATPGLEINFIFRRVRDDVIAATHNGQHPHVYGALGSREFYLVPPPKPVESPQAAKLREEEAKRKAEEAKKREDEIKAREAEVKRREEEAARLKAELDRKKAELRDSPKAPAVAKPAENVEKRKQADPPPAKRARPSALKYSLKLWPPGTLKRGQTVSAETPYGRLVCTSQGAPGGGSASRPCHWAR